MAFLNGYVEEDIFMDQSEDFTSVEKNKGLSSLKVHLWPQTSFSKLEHTFDEVVRGYDFIKNENDPCVYKKVNGSSVVYVVLYIDDILLIGNDVKMLGDNNE
ncbi:UNVERIFIED_CONTAM: hypothetical protein Scaly_3019500 [Sesamum calycinum]|uniref:Reverse transcriptase Ty1/copia-type domain-containing protein n=1 Tax=Sesamum calycinum TaxID=2727403 RepID=A0AAW2K7P7_9LAMI